MANRHKSNKFFTICRTRQVVFLWPVRKRQTASSTFFLVIIILVQNEASSLYIKRIEGGMDVKAYKLLAVNIDGAIFGKDSKISRRTKEAINYLKYKGITVVLTTSQPFSRAQKAAKALKLDGMVIAHGGALVADTDRNEWFNRQLEMDTTLDFCHILERFDCDARLLYGDHAVATRPLQKQNLLARMSFSSPGEQLMYPTTYVDSLYEQVLKEGSGPLNISVKCENSTDLDHICEVLQKEIQSIEMSRINRKECVFVGAGAGKARALQWLTKQRGMEMEDVVAIGIGEEDIDMIEMAGLGVAMGNASGKLKEKASWVTRNVDQDGFAFMVHELFRKQLRLQVD